MDIIFRPANPDYWHHYLMSPDASFWVLGLFLAVDLLFQGINYLTLASYIKRELPPSSADV